MEILREGTGEMQFQVHADSSSESEEPHQALFLVVAYLPVLELMAMARVCRSFRDVLRDNVLPWLNIIVEKPLSARISDGSLMEISSKANGRVRSLAMMNCSRITDDGLHQVVAKNRSITKLSVAGCTGLTPGGLIKTLKLLAENNRRLKSLKIGGIYNLTKQDLEILLRLTAEEQGQSRNKNLYHDYNNLSKFVHEETNPSLDVGVCPKCNEVRAIFDCPDDTCESKKHLNTCRGCSFCIPRCGECGRCVEDDELGEAACADTLCLRCWLRLPKCSFCNKAYCRQHADQQCKISEVSGFICVTCQYSTTRNDG